MRELHVQTSALRAQGETFYILEAYDAAGHRSYSNWSLGLNVVDRSPSAGAISVSRTVAQAQVAGSKYLSSTDELGVAWGGFVATGCPEKGKDFRFFYDPTCATGPRFAGCNAEGVGEMCRACGDSSTCAPYSPDYSNLGGLQYELCIGTTPLGCQLRPFEPMAANTAWYDGDAQMRCGATYYATVRATNCAGLQRSVASSGVTVCCDPPTEGAVTVTNGAGTAITYLTDEVNATISWAGFEEPCSGVAEYEVSVLTDSGQVLWQAGPFGNDTFRVSLNATGLAALPEELGLTVRVIATSQAGHSTPVDRFIMVDRSPPLVGHVYDSIAYNHISCLNTEQQLEVSWADFTDNASGVASVLWGMGTIPGLDDLMAFRVVDGGESGYARAEPADLNVPLQVGMTLFNSIKVQNAAGLETLGSSGGVSIVRRACEKAAICLPPPPQPAMTATLGAHPVFASLLYGFVDFGGSRLTYDIAGTTMMPRDGKIQLKGEVHLQQVGRRGTDSARLVSLHAQRVYTIDRHGAAHSVDEYAGVARSPTYYWQALNGTILEVP